jgi:hypothetical protein
MTRKDFELIATTIHNNYSLDENFTRASEYWELLAKKMAKALQATNPRFDEARFLRACVDDKAGAA